MILLACGAGAAEKRFLLMGLWFNIKKIIKYSYINIKYLYNYSKSILFTILR